jgi:hypothetical protein
MSSESLPVFSFDFAQKFVYELEIKFVFAYIKKDKFAHKYKN